MISVRIDQTDTGKGTPLQRSFSNTFSQVPKSKSTERKEP